MHPGDQNRHRHHQRRREHYPHIFLPPPHQDLVQATEDPRLHPLHLNRTPGHPSRPLLITHQSLAIYPRTERPASLARHQPQESGQSQGVPLCPVQINRRRINPEALVRHGLGAVWGEQDSHGLEQRQGQRADDRVHQGQATLNQIHCNSSISSI